MITVEESPSKDWKEVISYGKTVNITHTFENKKRTMCISQHIPNQSTTRVSLNAADINRLKKILEKAGEIDRNVQHLQEPIQKLIQKHITRIPTKRD